MSGSSRRLPIGWRDSDIIPALLASKMNFIQRSVRIAALSVPSMPAFWHIARKASPRALRLPSSSPNTIRMKAPTCVMTPGAVIEAETCATPGITARSPRIGISRSCASMPFCSVMTAVSGPTSGLMCAPALSMSHSLTQNSTKSTSPISAGLSVACVGTRWVSPRALSTFRPALFMAARCAPRATKVTSAPALASAAPYPPPTPPAPTTAIRIEYSDLFVGRHRRGVRGTNLGCATAHLRSGPFGSSRNGGERMMRDRARPRLRRHPVQGAELVAVGVAQIGDVEFHAAALADAGRILAGLAAMGEAGGVERIGLGLRCRRKSDGAAIGTAGGLAVDRLAHREGAGLGAPENAVAVDAPLRDAERAKQRIVERLGFVEVVGPDHDMRKHRLILPRCQARFDPRLSDCKSSLQAWQSQLARVWPQASSQSLPLASMTRPSASKNLFGT